jgi:hypothetical protein
MAALIPAIGAVIMGVQKQREERAKRLADTSRADRTDAVTILTTELTYWRDRADKQEARADELQRLVNTLQANADHAADVGTAALLQLQVAQRKAQSK